MNRYSYLLCGLMGVGAGLLLAPKTGIWNKYLTGKTREGQKLISGGIKRAEEIVADAADGIIDALETGRKTITT